MKNKGRKKITGHRGLNPACANILMASTVRCRKTSSDGSSVRATLRACCISLEETIRSQPRHAGHPLSRETDAGTRDSTNAPPRWVRGSRPQRAMAQPLNPTGRWPKVRLAESLAIEHPANSVKHGRLVNCDLRGCAKPPRALDGGCQGAARLGQLVIHARREDGTALRLTARDLRPRSCPGCAGVAANACRRQADPQVCRTARRVSTSAGLVMCRSKPASSERRRC